MSLNVCPNDIISTAKHFVTKLGMIMLHYEQERYAEKKKKVGIFTVKVTARAHMIKI